MSETTTTTALSGEFSQAGRSIAIDTPLGPDALLLTAIDGEDAISRPFVYTIEFLTKATDADVRGLIGKRVTLWLQNDSETWRRPVNGFIRRITGQPVTMRGFGGYRAEVVPRLWFMDCTADCRIFQTMTYPAIIKAVLEEYGVTDYDFKLLKTDYPTLDYCVQYRESALAFVSRLMEHVGIFFFHEHTAGSHRLIVTDANSFTKYVPQRQLRTNVRSDLGEIQRVWTDTVFRPGVWTLSDYDFEAPSKLMKKQTKTTLSVALMPQHEWFDFPGGYTDQGVGSWLARIRMETEEAHHDRLFGLATAAAPDPGYRFELVDTAGNGQHEPVSYLFTETRHHAHERTYYQDGPEASDYSCDFVAIPAATQFRPLRLTPKSVMRGSQTAIVVSPTHGDPIYTDEYGRVKVHFHWDRRGKPDSGATSCWLRVSQNSAGAGFGGIAIPHAGQEVVVDFLEGDPDRPLIVGRVHNAEKVAPVELPLDKHKTITRDHGGNKIVMDGEAGQENLSVMSPRTLNLITMSGIAKSLSAAAIDDKQVTSHPVGGQNPGYADLLKIAAGLPTAGGSGVGNHGSQNTIVEVDINSYNGGNSNTYTDLDTNSWTGGTSNTRIVGVSNTKIDETSNTTIDIDSNTTVQGFSYSYTGKDSTTKVHGASKTEVDGPTYSQLNDISYTDIHLSSTTHVHGEAFSYNHSNAYSRTWGRNTSLTLGFATNTVVLNSNNITLALVTNTNAAGVLNFGKAWTKDVVVGKRSIFANEVTSECDQWKVKSTDATFVTDTFNVRRAQAVTLSASDKLSMGGSEATTKILGSTVSLSCTGKCELSGGMITLG